MVCNPFNVLLLMCSLLVFFEDFCIYMYKKDWSVVLFSSGVFVFFWYQDNADLIECVRKCSLCFYCLEALNSIGVNCPLNIW